MSVIGLDLAGAELRPTGFCRLIGMVAQTALLYADEEVLKATIESLPRIVAIDAPLSRPPGRRTMDDRTNEHLRESDKELLRRGIKFFPITMGPMRKLTERGVRLREILEEKGLVVIEAYAGGAQDVLGLPRKQQGLDRLKHGLEELGITGLKEGLSDHELDAVTCAYVGKLFLEGKTVAYGTPEQMMVMPKPKS